MGTTTAKSPRYTVIIQWSSEDNCYVASLPEWAPRAIAGAHGATYEEAAKNAQEVLELLMQEEDGVRPANPPPEKLFRYPGADVVDLPDPSTETDRSKNIESRRSA